MPLLKAETEIYVSQDNYNFAEKTAKQLVKLFPKSNESYSILARSTFILVNTKKQFPYMNKFF